MSFLPAETPLWVWILSQIASIPAMFFIAKAFRYGDAEKDKARLFTVFHNLALAVSSALLMNWMMVTVLVTAAIRDYLFNWREKRFPKSKVISFAVFAVFMAITGISNLATMTWWFDWLLMASALFMIYATWVKGMTIMFWGRFAVSSFAIVSHWVFNNYATAIMAALTIIIVTIGFWTKKNKKGRKEVLTLQTQQNTGMRLVQERENHPDFRWVEEKMEKIRTKGKPLLALGSLGVIWWGMTFKKASWRATFSTYSLISEIGLKEDLNGLPVSKKYIRLVNHHPGAFMFQARVLEYENAIRDAFQKGQAVIASAAGAGLPEFRALKDAPKEAKLILIDKDPKAKEFALSLAERICPERTFEYIVGDALEYTIATSNACLTSIGFGFNYLTAKRAGAYAESNFKNKNVVRFITDGIYDKTAATDLMETLFDFPTVNAMDNHEIRALQSFNIENMEKVIAESAKEAGRKHTFSAAREYKYGFIGDVSLQ